MNENQANTTESTPSNQSPKRLYKSRRDKMIDGVCGGIADYFEIDPTIVRILWVLITLAGGSGIFLYIAAMIVMPANPEHIGFNNYAQASKTKFDHRRFWGILLILLGAFILISNLGIFAAFSWWSISWKVIFPLTIIGAGVALILVEMKNRRPASSPMTDATNTETQFSPPPKKELVRAIRARKIFGVCGGVAKYLDVDSTIVRIVYLILIFASFGWALLLYIVLTLLMPEEKLTTTL